MPASDLSFSRLREHPLWITGILSFAGYLLIRFWFPLSPHFDQTPLADVRTFTPSLGQGLAYGLVIGGLFALYGLAYRRVQQMDRPPSVVAILLAAVLFGLPLLQTYPINATDIYRYFIRGRISSTYHRSPFSVPPSAFSDDPFLPLAGEWADATSPYGPVWELTAGAVTQISQSNLYLGLLLFKGLGLLTHLVAAGLIWFLLKGWRRGERIGRTLLWAWNPALLLAFVANAHNDGLMLLWLLLGLWVVGRDRPIVGFLFIALAPLTKPIGLLPLPLFLLAIWRQLPHNQAKARFLLASSAGTLALVALTFLPFGPPWALVQRLIQEASSGGGFSVTTLIVLVSRGLGIDLSVGLVARVAQFLFGLVVLWLLWRVWRGRSPVQGTADIFGAYILQALNFRIWYSVWPFPWLLLDQIGSNNGGDGTPYRLRVGLWFLLTAQLSALIYGHLRVYALAGSHLLAHLIGVPLTFGLPFVLASTKTRKDKSNSLPAPN